MIKYVKYIYSLYDKGEYDRMGMIKKIDHIGIVVENLDEALKTLTKAFSCKVTEKPSEPKGYDVRVAFVSVGNAELELIQPLNGGMGQFLREKGPGIHHIAFEVANIEDAMKKVKEKGVGFQEGYEKPREAPRGKIVFMDSNTTNGARLQFIERKKKKC